MIIVLASSNQGKIQEINQLVAPFDITIKPQSEYEVMDVEENGLSFVENALIKARHAALITGLPALADDSGLVVPILNGEPGIYSARYAGTPANPDHNIEKLLDKLKNVAEENRVAYFFSVIVMLRNEKDPCPIICEGIWRGRILHQREGAQGFGYDPIFYDFTNKCSAAEMLPEIKNKVSHRGKAMKQLLKVITEGI